MTTQDLCSVRMRASSAETHVSGAERLVPRERIDSTVRELVLRALSKTTSPYTITVTVDLLCDTQILPLTSLDLFSLTDRDHDACRALARELLLSAGVSGPAVEVAITALDRGASPSGGNMRGAMLIDAATGARLEPDQARGVRVSRFDWTEEASDAITRALATIGLTHFRTREALALATKVAHAPGIIAELCWSDDPDYTAGYVASGSRGYVRLPHMKLPGSICGGRAFFIRSSGCDVAALIDYLQLTPVLISEIGTCRHSEGALLPGGEG